MQSLVSTKFSLHSLLFFNIQSATSLSHCQFLQLWNLQYFHISIMTPAGRRRMDELQEFYSTSYSQSYSSLKQLMFLNIQRVNLKDPKYPHTQNLIKLVYFNAIFQPDLKLIPIIFVQSKTAAIKNSCY